MKTFLIGMCACVCLSGVLWAGREIGPQDALISGDRVLEGNRVCIGDFNGDSIDDFVFATPEGFKGKLGKDDIEGVNLVDFDVKLGFDYSGLTNLLSLEDLPSTILKAFDINADGKDDLFVGVPNSNKLMIFFGDNTSWNSNMDETDVDMTITVSEAGYFSYDFDVVDFNGDEVLDLVVAAPGYKETGAVYLYKSIMLNQTEDLIIINQDSAQVYGVSTTFSKLSSSTGYDLAIGGETSYVISQSSLHSPSQSVNSAANIAQFKIKLPNQGVAISSTSILLKGHSLETLFVSDQQASMVYGFFGSQTFIGDVLLSQANVVISGNSMNNIGSKIKGHDVDQDGFGDLSISGVNFRTSSGNELLASGVVKVIANETLSSSSNSIIYLDTVENLVTFYGSDFSLAGIDFDYGDVNGDEFMDIFMGGISKYFVHSSGLDPYPSIDINVFPSEGLSVLRSQLSANVNFGDVQWTVEGSSILSGNTGTYDFSRGEFLVGAKASRNGFVTQASPVKVVSTNNTPKLSPALSEYTVNTGDNIHATFSASDKDGDAITTTLNINGVLYSNGDTQYRPEVRQQDQMSFTVSDSTSSATESLTLTVLNNPPKSTFSFSSTRTVEENEVLKLGVMVDDYERDALSVSLYQDAFLSLSGSDNISNHILNTSIVGNHELQVKVSDAEDGESHHETFAVKKKTVVNRPPYLWMNMNKNSANPNEIVTIHGAFWDVDSTSSLTLKIKGATVNPTISSNTFSYDYNTGSNRGFISVVAECRDELSTSSITKSINVVNNLPKVEVSLDKNVVYVNEIISVGVSASDVDNDSLSASVNGLTMSGAGPWTQTISFTSVGIQTIKVLVSDGYDSQIIEKTVKVVALNHSPIVSFLITTPYVINGSNPTFFIETKDADGDSFSYDVSVNGSTVDSSQASSFKFYTLTNPTTGSYDVIVKGTDARGATFSGKYRFYSMETIPNGLPRITPTWSSANLSTHLGQTVTSTLTPNSSTSGFDSVVFKINETLSSLSNQVFSQTMNATGNFLLDVEVTKSGYTQFLQRSFTVSGNLTQLLNPTLSFSSQNFNFGTNVQATSNANVKISETEAQGGWIANRSGIVSAIATLGEISTSQKIGVYPSATLADNVVIELLPQRGSLINGENITFSTNVFSSTSEQSSLSLLVDETSQSLSSFSQTLSRTVSKKGSKRPLSLTFVDEHGVYIVSTFIVSHNRIPDLELLLEDNSITVTETVGLTLSGADKDGDVITASFYADSTEVTKSSNLSASFTASVGAEKVYVISANVSDGEDSYVLKKNLEVTKIFKNGLPALTLSLQEVTIEEDESSKVKIVATDADGDHLSVSLFQNGNEVTLVDEGSGVHSYLHQGNGITGSFVYEAKVSDGKDVVTDSVTLTVIKKNTIPTIELISSKNKIREKKTVFITINVADVDVEDFLETKLFVDDVEVVISGNGNKKEYIFTPSSSGNYTFKAIVNDGQDSAKSEKVIEVSENAAPIIDLSLSNPYPKINVGFKVNVTVSDLNAEEDHSIDMSINNRALVSNYKGSTFSYDLTIADQGLYLIKVVASDGDKTTTKSINFRVYNIDVGDGGISPDAASIVSSMSSQTTISDGNKIIKNLAEQFQGHDLAGSLAYYSSTVSSVTKLRNFSSEDIHVSVFRAEDVQAMNNVDPLYPLRMEGIPKGNDVVMATIPKNYDQQLPPGAEGKLIELSMFSGNVQITDGFEVSLSIERQFNADAQQSLYVKDPKTGDYSDSGFEVSTSGEDVVFRIRHFSTYVLVNRQKNTASDLITIPQSFQTPISVPGGDNGTGAGGGCLLKVRK